MVDLITEEIFEFDSPTDEDWADFVLDQGWGDGMPAIMPTEERVRRFVEAASRSNELLPPVPPRWVMPTLESLAANAVMAGCRPEYFPVILAALRATAREAYNLHSILATTHPCGNMVMVSGPGRAKLGINAGANCFGQGYRANATIGRAVQLIMLNIGGAKPGTTDRSTQGTPAKYSFCFGENEEESPWEPYRIRHGFAAEDTIVTVLCGEAPHNINDHGSTDGEGLILTTAESLSQSGTNNLLGLGPCFVVFSPEHARTLHRDGWTVASIQEALYERSKVHKNRVATGMHDFMHSYRPNLQGDYYYLAPSPDGIHIVVAGGAGKHSAHIPSWAITDVISERVTGL